MKILHVLVFPLWGSGSGTYARKLAQNLAHEGHEVAIVAPEERELKGVKIYPVKMPLHAAFTMHPEWPDAKRYSDLSDVEISDLYIAFLSSIIDAVEDFKPDVIHVHHSSILTWIASYIKGIYAINYIVSEHGTSVMAASIDSRYFALTRDALQRAEYVIPVSGDTKRWFLKVFGRKFDWKTRIITGGIDLKTYPKNGPITAIEKKYQLKNKKVVLFSGKLTKIKGVEYLIKAAPKIHGHIFIMGDGEERKNLEALAKKHNITNVHFLGYFDKSQTDELKMFYRRADVVVFPSVWDEPLGLVALEAMASSTPVVASNKGGIPLAVKNGYNGFLVRARSSSQIAEAVNKILDNPELQAKFGENARKTAEEKFSWRLIAESFVKLYQDAHKKAQASRLNRKLKRQQEKRLLDDEKRELLNHTIELP
ncbi:MAG TPA: glycosyltransferase family 4 protein [Candidatus Saccharimonadales bacterium]|nr:glycosyltransferase family 4 protein [Candidatus Saccharimonadales bacterium]